ncbi:hypothetical protein QW180_27090 [Vibrio sinaloensis]|nr:hypothetical protein [Vibrio sinaloensis]
MVRDHPDAQTCPILTGDIVFFKRALPLSRQKNVPRFTTSMSPLVMGVVWLSLGHQEAVNRH